MSENPFRRALAEAERRDLLDNYYRQINREVSRMLTIPVKFNSVEQFKAMVVKTTQEDLDDALGVIAAYLVPKTDAQAELAKACKL